MSWDFHSLFKHHGQGILRALIRRGHDPELGADLTQDAFLRAIARQNSGALTEPPAPAYLYKIARNLGINHRRREALIAMTPLDTPEAERAAPRAPDTERVVAARQDLALIRQTLAAMPPRQRRAFVLHRIEGWPIARIAEDIGLSPSRTWEIIRDAYRQIVLSAGEI